MSLPTVVKTWTITSNNRIPFISLLDTMQRYLFGVKAFLKSHGYTVKGSASAGTGAMDGVDRWTLSTDVTPRGAAAGNSQAWVVLTDANGCDLLLAFQGATDDVARISYSAGGIFVAAGTPQNQPTATDEAVISTGLTLINGTASQDRMWFGWVDSTSKLCRFMIARNGLCTGVLWGLELVGSSTVTGGVVVWSPVVWGFGFVSGSNSGGTVGVARVLASSVGTTCVMVWGWETVANQAAVWGNVKIELQGARSYHALPLYVGSTTTGARGKFGALFDQWVGRTSGGVDGEVYGSLRLIGVSGFSANTGGLLWPWDNTTTPILI